LRAKTSPDVQEAQVHFVMNSTDAVTGPGGMRSKNIVQHVCELIPTVTLFPDSNSTLLSATSSAHPSPTPATSPGFNSMYGTALGHQYSNSIPSSFHSHSPSITPTVQTQSYPSSHGHSQPGYTTSQGSTRPSSYSSSDSPSQHNYTSPTSQHSDTSTTQAPWQGYARTQTQLTYAPQQAYTTGSLPQNSNSLSDAPYDRGGFTRPSLASVSSQQDLRHVQPWRP